MPAYLNGTRIDWHYDRAKPELRPLLQEANLDLSSRDHTLATFEERLRKYATNHAALVADALVQDEDRRRWLYRARGGAVSKVEVDERLEGAANEPLQLPLDEIATVTLLRDVEALRAELQAHDGVPREGNEVDLPLDYADEESMRDVLARVAKATAEGRYRFVAEVEHHRFIVDVRPRMLTVRKLVPVTEPVLVSRLLRGRFTEVPEPPPRPGERRDLVVWLPEHVLDAMSGQANRLDVSHSNLAQKAWRLAGERLRGADAVHRIAQAHEAFDGGLKWKKTFIFPGEMLLELRARAAELDTQPSFLLCAAWLVAKADIEAMPPPPPEPE